MADNKFGLSDALINAVRQVAENSAPLPRDERERDLERQSRLKPKSLDEAAAPKKKPSGGFGAALMDNMKKDPVMYAGASLVGKLASTIAKKVLKKEQFEVGDTSDVYFYEKRLSPEQKKLASLDALDGDPNNIGAGDLEAARAGKMREETELDEAKLTAAEMRAEIAARRALNKKPITPEQRVRAAARRAALSPEALKKKAEQQANLPKKPQAYVHPEGKPNNTEKPTPKDNPNENIINQLNKEALEGKNRITFRNGKTHLLPTSIVNKARTLHGNMHPSKKVDFQERLAASLESFLDAVKNPKNEAPKPKGREARLAPKPMLPDFEERLKQMAAAHNARQKEKAKGK